MTQTNVLSLSPRALPPWLSLRPVGDFLKPDEVSFAVLLRGYGAGTTPDWPKIDSTLTSMRLTYGILPTAGAFMIC